MGSMTGGGMEFVTISTTFIDDFRDAGACPATAIIG
jgi:hypothetical protein